MKPEMSGRRSRIGVVKAEHQATLVEHSQIATSRTDRERTAIKFPLARKPFQEILRRRSHTQDLERGAGAAGKKHGNDTRLGHNPLFRSQNPRRRRKFEAALAPFVLP